MDSSLTCFFYCFWDVLEDTGLFFGWPQSRDDSIDSGPTKVHGLVLQAFEVITRVTKQLKNMRATYTMILTALENEGTNPNATCPFHPDSHRFYSLATSWGHRGSETERPFLKEVTSTQMWASWIGRETSDVELVEHLLPAVVVMKRRMAEKIFGMRVGEVGHNYTEYIRYEQKY